MAGTDLNDEPISIATVHHEDRPSMYFSDIPQRILPALVDAYGQQSIAQAIAMTPAEQAFVNRLEVNPNFRPRFLAAHKSGLLEKRVAEAEKMGIVKKTAPYFMTAVNLGDEAVLGKTGVIYFVCHKGCHFCQYRGFDEEVLDAQGIADRMLGLQNAGAHNVQWLSPSEHTGILIKALSLAAEQGFVLPIVHKSEGDDPVDQLKLLDGLVDMYLPDAKFINASFAKHIGLPPSYGKRMKAGIAEMYRQVGPLKRVSEDGVLQAGGLLVRHLLMPGGVEESLDVYRFLSSLDQNLPVNVMTGYEPMHDAVEMEMINRQVTDDEIEESLKMALKAKLQKVLFSHS